MALDTSLLQATGANNRSAADRQAEQVKTADTVNLERQKMQNENMQQAGQGLMRGVEQGVQQAGEDKRQQIQQEGENKRQMFVPDQALADAYKKSYGEADGRYQFVQARVGKQTPVSMINMNDSMGSKMEIAKVREEYGIVNKKQEIKTTDPVTGKQIIKTQQGIINPETLKPEWKDIAVAERFDSEKGPGSKNSQDKEQNKLEKDYRSQLLSLRGDNSLKSTETQRDAAIIAYNRISQIEKTGKTLNPIDYVDILGQIYKARTGTAPTQEVLKEAKQETSIKSLGKFWTYATGQQMPATSKDIQDSLKEMAAHMGTQADELHEGYMATHLIAPSELEESRAKKIRDTGRGKSFQEATGYKPDQGAQSSSPVGGGTQELKRKTKDGKTAIYDANTKAFIRYE